jgi:squalene synthase HpnC
VGVDHYENFPVASVLCPPRIRPAVVAIYHFARTADDIADEGDEAAEPRRAVLREYRTELEFALQGGPRAGRWERIFGPLAARITEHRLPAAPLRDLLEAFERDTANPWYDDRPALLDYCRCSANPVGRLLLHLYGIDDAVSLRQSDAICTALQLVNFWQDLSVDLPRGRIYLPAEDAHRHGVALGTPGGLRDSLSMRRLVQTLCAWAESEMHQGAPLALAMPGRVGWELRLVVQGGMRVLHKIRASGYDTAATRPVLTATDLPAMIWRGLHMRRRINRGFA